MGVLALQGDVREHLDALAACRADGVAVRTVGELQAVDALILPGGESTTMSRLLRVFGLEDALRQRLADGLPCMATCAGVILLAKEVADGRTDQLSFDVLDVAVRRNAWGRQRESFESAIDVNGFNRPFHSVFIRAPRIEAVGSGVEVLATYNAEPVAVATGQFLGLTFHPELTDDLRLHQLFLDRVAHGVPA